MIKTYFITLGIIFVILTISVGIIKPTINKPVKFSNSNFQIQSTEITTPTEKLANNNAELSNNNNAIEIPAPAQNVKVVDIETSKTTQTTKIIQNIKNEKSKTIQVKPAPTSKTQTQTKEYQQAPIKTTTKNLNTQNKNSSEINKTINSPKIPQSVQNIITKTPSQTEVSEQISNSKPPVEKPKVVLPKIESKPIEQLTPAEIIQQAEAENRLLTEREEIIVWNVWRSNLQNKIMRDTKISAPLGTTFKFSFTVDNRGRISNLRTWAIPETYNSIAVNYIKPLILSYQGQPILNFPQRTKRVITNVTGGFVISTQDRFSTPNDFSDIERIKTTR